MGLVEELIHRKCTETLQVYHFVFFVSLQLGLILVHELRKVRRNRVLHHVIIMWFAILTSQKGQMLDVWLLVTMTMDFLPLIFALLDTWRKGLFEFKDEEASLAEGHLIPLDAFWNMSTILSQWAPAYQLNQQLRVWVDDDFVHHFYLLILLSVVITESRLIFLSMITDYCGQPI